MSRLRIDGFEPAELAGEDFRLAVGRTLGWQVLKSTLFDVERTAAGYRFRGSGRGHGVGLCVLGAARMAAGGATARGIVERYFPGTEILAAKPGTAPLQRARLEITLPAGEERERDRIEGLGEAGLREFSARCGVPVPRQVQLVFHPTVEAYARASGQPWWTTGATRGARVDFIPLTALRQRGLLEETIRHELAHVVTGGRLTGKPIWVQEAVAMNLAGDPRFADSPPQSRTPGRSQPRPAPVAASSCPTDAEWRAVRSPDVLQRAYQRAAACFAAQRATGRGWDDIR